MLLFGKHIGLTATPSVSIYVSLLLFGESTNAFFDHNLFKHFELLTIVTYNTTYGVCKCELYFKNIERFCVQISH